MAMDPFQLSSVFGILGIEELATAADKLPFTFGIYASSDAQSSQFDTTGEHVSAETSASTPAARYASS